MRGTKRLEKGTERKVGDSKGKNTYVKTVYGQLYIMKTRIKSNSISLPPPIVSYG